MEEVDNISKIKLEEVDNIKKNMLEEVDTKKRSNFPTGRSRGRTLDSNESIMSTERS